MALTKCLAIDCEMVGTGPKGKYAHLARVSVVNEYNQCIYDEYVCPEVQVTDYRTWITGITKRDLINGLPFAEVREDVRRMIKRRIVVGHGLRHDFEALRLSHPEWNIRDTAEYPPFIRMNRNRKPSLRWLARKILNVDIQNGVHCSSEDASAVMQIYKRYRRQWEAWLAESDDEYDDDDGYYY